LPVLRVLLLIILFFALTNPVFTYTRVTSADEVREDQPTSTSHLLSIQDVSPPSGLGLTVRSTYGTLDDTTNSPARTPSLVASDHETSKIKVHIYVSSQVESLIPLPQPVPKEKEEDHNEPTFAEILRRIGRITPYLWPKKSRALQLVAVCSDF
jgi:hypothetical protein